MLVVCEAAAADPRPAALDALAQRHFKSDQPGATVLVTKDGKTLLRKGYGLASVELQVPVRPDTVFHVASVGKQFTAAAVLRLVEQGKLDLKAPLSRYLPGTPAAWSAITLEHLLTHTSGIGNLFDDEAYRARVREDATPAQLLAVAAAAPLRSEPGSEHRYASINYSIAGMVIAQVSGKPYEAFLSEQLFTPLGMRHTVFDHGDKLIKGVATPYIRGPKQAPYMSKTIGYAAGSYYSTTGDLAIWHAALAGGKVVSPANLKAMTTSFRLKDGGDSHYGLGLRVHRANGQPYLQSNGDIPGFHSELVSLPQTGVFVAILSNGEELPFGLDPLARRLAAIASGTPMPALASAAIAPDAARALVGRYQAGDDGFSIVYKDGHLYSQIEGNAPDLLGVISPSEMYLDANQDTRFRFKLEGGKAVSVRPGDLDRGEGPVYLRIGG